MNKGNFIKLSILVLLAIQVGCRSKQFTAGDKKKGSEAEANRTGKEVPEPSPNDQNDDGGFVPETPTPSASPTASVSPSPSVSPAPVVPKLIFAFIPPKTATRSREVFSKHCTEAANKAGYPGQFKAVISLTTKYTLHADDAAQKLNAKEYAVVAGPVKNVAGDIVADGATDFWSVKHKKEITDLTKVVIPLAITTGSTAEGVYPAQCASDDSDGKRRGCNCENLQVADGGHGKRFVGGSGSLEIAVGGNASQNWAFYLSNKEGQTICTFNHSKYSPSPIYCLEQ